jgi:hypothetical protein
MSEKPPAVAKATFYMNPETIEKLEDLWMETRKVVGKELRAKVTKSMIVERAIHRLARDLQGLTAEETIELLDAAKRETKPDSYSKK